MDKFLQSVKLNGLSLKDVPPARRDRNLCMAAVKKSAFALFYVPCALRDKEIVGAAFAHEGFSDALKNLRDAAR